MIWSTFHSAIILPEQSYLEDEILALRPVLDKPRSVDVSLWSTFKWTVGSPKLLFDEVVALLFDFKLFLDISKTKAKTLTLLDNDINHKSNVSKIPSITCMKMDD